MFVFVDGVAETFGLVSDEELLKPGAVSKPRFDTTGAGEFLKYKCWRIRNSLKFKLFLLSKHLPLIFECLIYLEIEFGRNWVALLFCFFELSCSWIVVPIISDPLDVPFADTNDDDARGTKLQPSDCWEIELAVLAVLPRECRIVLGST